MAPKKASTPQEPEKRGRGRPLEGEGGRRKTPLPKNWKLSKELAAIVGSDVTNRQQVIKKLHKVIKERKLQDPENGQFCICDDQLFKVIGVKRFRTFSMTKYLTNHFLEDV